jgi:hypothetical protein
MKKNFTILGLCLCLLLLGCGTQTALSATPLITSIVSETPFIKPSNNPISQSQTATLLPVPATRPAELQTRYAALKIKDASGTETLIAYFPTQEILQATREAARETAISADLQYNQKRGIICDAGFDLETLSDIRSMSTDEWTIFTCKPDYRTTPDVDYLSRYTRVVKTDLTQSWTISYKNLIWANIPIAYLKSYKWSRDGKYLFLVAYTCCYDGYFASNYFHNESILYRLNLDTGIFETILTGAHSLEISPDDQYLIFTNRDNPDAVYIRNLSNGTDKQVQFDKDVVAAGIFAWAPDSSQVIFGAGYGPGIDAQNDLSETSIFKLTIKDSTLQPLLYKDPRLLVPNIIDQKTRNFWVDKNRIPLFSLKREYDNLNNVSMDVQTGNIQNFFTPTADAETTSTPQP